MKEIKAYIRCERAHKALCEAGLKYATLTHVLAAGAEVESYQAEMNIEKNTKVNYKERINP